MEEIKTYTLEELIKGKGNYGIAASAVPYNPSLRTYLRITDINDDGTLNKSSMMSVDEKNADAFLLKPNDIVFARTGNSTGRSYFYDGSDGELVYAGFLIKFSLDETKVNPRILKYYTHSKLYYDWVHSFDTGGTRGNINAKTYGTMPIMLPSRDVQNRIVDILKSLDNKIELNRRINDNLEQQAQALFNHFFIEQPALLGKYSLGNLTDSANYINGLAMQKFRPREGEQGIPVLKIKELGQGRTDTSSDICSESIDEVYKVYNGDIIFSWSGTLMVKIWCGGKCGLNQHLFKVTSEQYPKWFYYFWTKHHLDKFIRIAQDKAVTMGHIKRGELEKSEVLFPDTVVLNKIDDIISPIFNQIIGLKCENRNLTKTRDTLLPKLMSGELNVNKINC
ncbi:restriction endonuclease subunit S [Parabacteroides sp. AF48-14]|uniref:restriction endonuclease subunit S n=1 Tax=Parabacteroides sp. AF48-14 TaxID=2292052 RepID=UPI000EFECF58|nr:restriction endonuclease subunit S [Parabacteroides sp. AF48-14]RHO75339.1 restriction endonuclease subunit S [Parabacteroides sp. AF48-14]